MRRDSRTAPSGYSYSCIVILHFRACLRKRHSGYRCTVVHASLHLISITWYYSAERLRNAAKLLSNDLARSRTWNPLIRSQMPYPLGHKAGLPKQFGPRNHIEMNSNYSGTHQLEFRTATFPQMPPMYTCIAISCVVPNTADIRFCRVCMSHTDTLSSS